MTFLAVLLAILLDWRFGEIRNHHPLVYFGALANWVEQRTNPYQDHSVFTLRLFGTLAVIAIVIVPTIFLNSLLTDMHDAASLITWVIEIIGLYFCIGRQSLHEHAMAVYNPLKAGDLAGVRAAVGMIVSRETKTMTATDATTATVESVLENSNDACFGTIFWFVIGGLPLAIIHRLSNTLDAMWGYKTVRFYSFGWAAARLDDLLNWIPARLGALSLAVLGHRQDAFQCWKEQAPLYPSPNGGVIMAAGAGALNIKLGGDAIYHGELKKRTVLGCGREVIPVDIPRSSKLVNHAVILWLVVIFCLDLFITGWLF